jgi:hypothetical protein
MSAGFLICGLPGIAARALALEGFRHFTPDQQRPAPAFALPDYQSTPFSLASLHGKVVVVRFWATW